jgi:SAM-dependent methyltransferase
MSDLSALYDLRFNQAGLAKRQAVWAQLCAHFFNSLIPADACVLDVACGYGEFINNIRAGRKYAVDLNEDAQRFLHPDVNYIRTSALDLSGVPKDQVDIAFTSNFLEHFRDKTNLDDFLKQLHGILKPGGKFIVLGPNIRFAYKEYWDFYDHYLPLSDRSLVEALTISGFKVERVIDRFLPFTMNSRAPTADFLIYLYLKMPWAWRFFGKQFLVVARK